MSSLEKKIPPKPIQGFAPGKDKGAFWREKMSNAIDEDVYIYYCEKKKCLVTEKKQ